MEDAVCQVQGRDGGGQGDLPKDVELLLPL